MIIIMIITMMMMIIIVIWWRIFNLFIESKGRYPWAVINIHEPINAHAYVFYSSLRGAQL